MIFEAESLVAARKLVESDIYYTAGVVSITLLLGAYLAAFLIRDMVSGTRKNCRFFPLGWRLLYHLYLLRHPPLRNQEMYTSFIHLMTTITRLVKGGVDNRGRATAYNQK